MSELGKVITRVESCLTSAKGFSALLEQAIQSPDSPLAAIELIVKINEAKPLVLGRALNDDPYHATTLTLNGGRHQNAFLRLWIHDNHNIVEQSMLDDIAAQIRTAFNIWWSLDSRSPKADLPMWTEVIKRSGQNALKLQESIGGFFSVIFCDLDNFKLVNNKFGQAGGDVIINKMATFLETTIGSEAVLIHHGGDEFVVVMPESAAHQAIALAAHIVTSAKNFAFGTGDLPLGISLGITSNSTHPSEDFIGLVKIADEKALKLLVKADPKVKGAMRVASTLTKPGNWKRPITPRALALILRCSLAMPPHSPFFASAWLNALVQIGRKEFKKTQCIKQTGESIFDAFKAFKISPGTIDISYIPGHANSIFEPQLSGLDVVAAYARVIFEASLTSIEAPLTSSIIIRRAERQTILSSGDETLMIIEGEPCEELSIELGAPWQIDREDSKFGSELQVNSSPFILMEIGRINLLALHLLAADHIVIDDRPGRGGGLPDFWELSLSRLIQSLVKFPNVDRVIIVGEKKNAQQTVAKLTCEASSWDIDYISYKTAVPKRLVRIAESRLQHKVIITPSEEDALEALIEIASARKKLRVADLIIEDEPSTLLPRKLDYPGALLGAADGCRVKTAAEAYPLMLELLRADNGNEIPTIDQDGVQLRELVDFKVVVEDVAREQIPWFFRDEKKALITYFEQQFLQPKGRFAEQLNASGFDKRILDHVRWALTRTDGAPFATRRALLVVPHAPAPAPDAVAPLGLVSLRILPRPASTETEINFSFTWRTVEALIGFPYSLYGSLRYSQYLYDELCKLCPSKQLRIGYLSYVAHSLHFFVSDESRRLARRIVSESSS